LLQCHIKVQIVDTIFARYFEDEELFCRELYMSRDEMREMIEKGMSFGGDSKTHPPLLQLTREQ